MAEKNFTKNSPEWNMFRDFYKICEQFWLPEKSDAYWKSLANAGDEFVAKYKHLHPAVAEITAGFLTGCDKKYRQDTFQQTELSEFMEDKEK